MEIKALNLYIRTYDNFLVVGSYANNSEISERKFNV